MTSKILKKRFSINHRKQLLLVLLIGITLFIPNMYPIPSIDSSYAENSELIVSPTFFDYGAIIPGANISGFFEIENHGAQNHNIEIFVSGAFSGVFVIKKEVYVNAGESVKINFWGIVPYNAKAGIYATYFIVSVKQPGIVAVGTSVLLKYAVMGLSIISISAPPTETGEISQATFRVAYVGKETIEISGNLKLLNDSDNIVFTGIIEKTILKGIVNVNNSIIDEENYQKVFQVSFGSLVEGTYYGEIIISSNNSLFDRSKFMFVVGKTDTSILFDFKPTYDANRAASLNVTISNKGTIPDHVLIKVDIISGETKLNHFEETRSVIGVENIIIYILPPAKGNYTVIANVRTDNGIIEQSYPLLVLIDKKIPEKNSQGITSTTKFSLSILQLVIFGGIFLLGLIIGRIIGKKGNKKSSFLILPKNAFREIWLFLPSGEVLGRYELSSGRELDVDEAIIAKILIIFSTLNNIEGKYLVIKTRKNQILLVTFINDIGVALKISSKIDNTVLEYSQVSIHQKVVNFVNKNRTNLIRGLVSLSIESIKNLLK